MACVDHNCVLSMLVRFECKCHLRDIISQRLRRKIYMARECHHIIGQPLISGSAEEKVFLEKPTLAPRMILMTHPIGARGENCGMEK